MAWRCDQCGFEANVDGSRGCEACGHVKFGPLVLVSEQTGRSIQMTLDTQVGKSLLKSFAGDDAVYASEPQFKLYRDAALGGWAIESTAGAKNRTFLNGSPLAETPVVLSEGASITLGPDKMRLTARLNT